MKNYGKEETFTHNDNNMGMSLLIDTSPEKLFLVNQEGLPVWPVQTAYEHKALLNLIKLFSAAKLKEVQGCPGITKSNHEEVVGIGKAVEELARLYAHLTHRRFRSIVNPKELNKSALPAVIVTLYPWLTNNLMEILYSSETDSAPGIICSSGLEKLRSQVLIRSASIFLSGALERKQINLFPTVSLEKLTKMEGEILGGKVSSSQIKSAIGCGAGVLNVMTHSDGVDAFLSSEATLCAIEDFGIEENKYLSPRCHITGFCHRQQVSVEEALKSNTLISPKFIKARILIWNVCLGFLLPGNVVNTSYGIANFLLESSTIGALLTTWEVVLTDPLHTQELSQSLLLGISVGKALAKFNSSKNSQQKGYKICLFGDPSLQLPKGNSMDLYELLKSSRTKSTTALLTNEFREASFLRACMNKAVLGASKRLRPLAQKALETSQVYEYAIRKRINVEGTPNAPGPIMRRALLQYVFHRGKLLDSWIPLVSQYNSLKTLTQCFICGEHSNTIIASLWISNTPCRRVSICPYCGVIEDAPIESNITFSLWDRSSLHVEGSLPHERWTGGILIGSSLPAENIGLEWPAKSDGTPATVLNLPTRLPPGPIQISVIMFWAGNFAIISQMVRGSDGNDK